jgi:serine O-acetyltransferase
MTLRETLRADFIRYCNPGVPYQRATWNTKEVVKAFAGRHGPWIILEYRLRRAARLLPSPWNLPLRILFVFTRRLIEWITGYSISSGADIGPGLYISHFGTTRVANGCVIGENLNLNPMVIIGGGKGGNPQIGHSAFIGPGAKLFGGLKIGDHVAVGANAVVTKDMPDRCLVVGIPARAIEGRGNMVYDD